MAGHKEKFNCYKCQHECQICPKYLEDNKDEQARTLKESED